MHSETMEAPTTRAVGVHVDRVTQLQDSIDQQCLMLVSSLDYLHKKAGMVQVGPSIPVTQTNVMADNAAEFHARTREIATDICRQAKKIDSLIEALPGIDVSESEQEREFIELEKQNEAATRDLDAATKKANALLDQISAILRTIADS
ncbi:hypothetical protein GQ54DRAFT_277251, partial [Martensiomyces pterosporus]